MKRLIIIFLSLIACNLSLTQAQNVPKGTVVGGGITLPDNQTDVPTHYDFLGKGGYRVVATKSERDTIKISRRSFNMLVHINDPACDSTFRLVRNPVYPDSLEAAIWTYWMPVVYSATYNMTKTTPPNDEVDIYPYHQARTPFYFKAPFLTKLYYLNISCQNDRGTVPYIILEQKKESFTIDVAEPCTCTWEAKERIVAQADPNIVDTGDGDITPFDVIAYKIGYAKGQRIVGLLNVDSLVNDAYKKGASDAIVFKKDPLWWDIKNIVADDHTPGYIAKMGLLISDSFISTDMSGADAYRTSDGAFYEVPPNTLVTHTWQPSAYKPDSQGGYTKYVIRYYKTAVISSTTANQPTFGPATATNRGLGCWPEGVVCKDGSIFMQNFLTNNYSLVFYDHINATYTGTNATGFVGGTNCFCLQGIPESITYPNPFPTTTTGMYSSRVIKKISVNGWDFSRLPTSLNGFFTNMYLLEEIDGIIDMSRITAWGTCLKDSYMLRKFKIRNCSVSISFSSSVIEYNTLYDLVWYGLQDMSGQTSPTLSLAQSWRSLTQDDKNELSRKNWTLVTA